jgi:hypothetical protein
MSNRSEMLVNILNFIENHESYTSGYDFIYRLKNNDCLNLYFDPWVESEEENKIKLHTLLKQSSDNELVYFNKEINCILDEINNQGV